MLSGSLSGLVKKTGFFFEIQTFKQNQLAGEILGLTRKAP